MYIDKIYKYAKICPAKQVNFQRGYFMTEELKRRGRRKASESGTGFTQTDDTTWLSEHVLIPVSAYKNAQKLARKRLTTVSRLLGDTLVSECLDYWLHALKTAEEENNPLVFPKHGETNFHGVTKDGKPFGTTFRLSSDAYGMFQRIREDSEQRISTIFRVVFADIVKRHELELRPFYVVDVDTVKPVAFTFKVPAQYKGQPMNDLVKRLAAERKMTVSQLYQYAIQHMKRKPEKESTRGFVQAIVKFMPNDRQKLEQLNSKYKECTMAHVLRTAMYQQLDEWMNQPESENNTRSK